jgi:hypothetical protein
MTASQHINDSHLQPTNMLKRQCPVRERRRIII